MCPPPKHLLLKIPACKGCRARHLCTRGKTKGRYIDRSEYVGFIQQDARRVEADPEYYRLRQQVTEHPFGTLKRQRGFALARKKYNVLGEVGLMFIGYNLDRCASILGVEKLSKRLKCRCLSVFVVVSALIWKLFKPEKVYALKIAWQGKMKLNSTAIV
jgi:hypothetical protein